MEKLDYIYETNIDVDKDLIELKTLNQKFEIKLSELTPTDEYEEFLITAKIINNKCRLDIQKYDQDYKMPGRPTPGSVSIIKTLTGVIRDIINK